MADKLKELEKALTMALTQQFGTPVQSVNNNINGLRRAADQMLKRLMASAGSRFDYEIKEENGEITVVPKNFPTALICAGVSPNDAFAVADDATEYADDRGIFTWDKSDPSVLTIRPTMPLEYVKIQLTLDGNFNWDMFPSARVLNDDELI